MRLAAAPIHQEVISAAAARDKRRCLKRGRDRGSTPVASRWRINLGNGEDDGPVLLLYANLNAGQRETFISIS